ncbi:hypothetical protein LXL04_000434 [Taraxacum kok-saghyz]
MFSEIRRAQVSLQDWWLTKPQTDDGRKTIGVSMNICPVFLIVISTKRKPLKMDFPQRCLIILLSVSPFTGKNIVQAVPKENLLMNVFQEEECIMKPEDKVLFERPSEIQDEREANNQIYDKDTNQIY